MVVYVTSIYLIENENVSFYYEGWSKITEPYLITFESSKMDINLDDISL